MYYRYRKTVMSSHPKQYGCYFLIFDQNIDCGFSLELHRRGGSHVYQQPIFTQHY